MYISALAAALENVYDEQVPALHLVHYASEEHDRIQPGGPFVTVSPVNAH
jgi:hypothetical protein